jgi:hypothetical protein
MPLVLGGRGRLISESQIPGQLEIYSRTLSQNRWQGLERWCGRQLRAPEYSCSFHTHTHTHTHTIKNNKNNLQKKNEEVGM